MAMLCDVISAVTEFMVRGRNLPSALRHNLWRHTGENEHPREMALVTRMQELQAGKRETNGILDECKFRLKTGTVLVKTVTVSTCKLGSRLVFGLRFGLGSGVGG
jgi:hypothetical protein